MVSPLYSVLRFIIVLSMISIGVYLGVKVVQGLLGEEIGVWAVVGPIIAFVVLGGANIMLINERRRGIFSVRPLDYDEPPDDDVVHEVEEQVGKPREMTKSRMTEIANNYDELRMTKEDLQDLESWYEGVIERLEAAGREDLRRMGKDRLLGLYESFMTMYGPISKTGPDANYRIFNALANAAEKSGLFRPRVPYRKTEKGETDLDYLASLFNRARGGWDSVVLGEEGEREGADHLDRLFQTSVVDVVPKGAPSRAFMRMQHSS